MPLLSSKAAVRWAMSRLTCHSCLPPSTAPAWSRPSSGGTSSVSQWPACKPTCFWPGGSYNGAGGSGTRNERKKSWARGVPGAGKGSGLEVPSQLARSLDCAAAACVSALDCAAAACVSALDCAATCTSVVDCAATCVPVADCAANCVPVLGGTAVGCGALPEATVVGGAVNAPVTTA